MILAELKGDRFSRNHRYCKGGSSWSIVAPKGDTMQEVDANFDDI